MKKPVIAVDFDDVIADFNRAFLAHHNEQFGSNVSYDNIVQFDLGEIYKIDRDTFVKRAKTFCHASHDEIEPIAGAKEALQKLSGKYELHVVTSRWDSLAAITEGWIERHFPNVFSGIHFVNKDTDEQHNSKSNTCHEIGALALIDDALHHVIDAVENDLKAVLLDRPWNQEILPDGAVRVYDWAEVVAWVENNVPT